MPVVVAVLAIVLAVVAVAAVAALVVSRRALADAARRHEALAHEFDAAREEAAAAAATLAVAREGLTAADALIRSLWSLELLRVAR